MLKYYVTAAALKGFSCTPLTRRVYRNLGNSVGGKKRATEKMPGYYLERINRMLRFARKYGIPQDGSRLLELGTGWCHWEALTARLFFDLRATLYDVWDNRQMGALKNYVQQLDGSLDQVDADSAQRASAHEMIGRINAVETYEELYQLLGFEYVLDPAGKLAPLESNTYDMAVSGGVLEHIYAGDARDIVNAVATVLKPGGYSVHSINIRDHLYLYDTTASPKQYLQYSDRVWKTWFSNDVQYINRIQRSEWLELFGSAGLKLVEEEIEPEEISGLKIAAEFAKFDPTDLSCGGLRLVHQRPA